jgi:hypothetical protein
MGFMSFDDFPMLPSGVWVYIIYFPNEDNSVDSVLMCNPSRIKILHWLEGSVKWYGSYMLMLQACEYACIHVSTQAYKIV